MKSNRCYICYEDNVNDAGFHPACLKKIFNTDIVPELSFQNKDIESMAFELVKQKRGLPGVQKKLSLALTVSDESNNKHIKRLTIVGYLGGGYILKPSSSEYPLMPEIEDLTMHLADMAGIKVALHGLLPMPDYSLAYITKRFDRSGNKKIAVEDLCQLSQLLTENKYRSSSEKVGKKIYQYSTIPGEEVLRFFELILFSFIVGNADMHLKNFSLITEDKNNIHLAPSYDLLSTRLLISEQDDPDELALPLNGKKRNIRKKDFIVFGQSLGIPEKVITNTIVRMLKREEAWRDKIAISFLSDALKKQFVELIRNRLKMLA